MDNQEKQQRIKLQKDALKSKRAETLLKKLTDSINSYYTKDDETEIVLEWDLSKHEIENGMIKINCNFNDLLSDDFHDNVSRAFANIVKVRKIRRNIYVKVNDMFDTKLLYKFETFKLKFNKDNVCFTIDAEMYNIIINVPFGSVDKIAQLFNSDATVTCNPVYETEHVVSGFDYFNNVILKCNNKDTFVKTNFEHLLKSVRIGYLYLEFIKDYDCLNSMDEMYFDNITKLNVSFSQLVVNKMDDFAKLINKMKSLVKLDIEMCYELDDENLQILCDGISSSTVSKLRFQNEFYYKPSMAKSLLKINVDYIKLACFHFYPKDYDQKDYKIEFGIIKQSVIKKIIMRSCTFKFETIDYILTNNLNIIVGADMTEDEFMTLASKYHYNKLLANIANDRFDKYYENYQAYSKKLTHICLEN